MANYLCRPSWSCLKHEEFNNQYPCFSCAFYYYEVALFQLLMAKDHLLNALFVSCHLVFCPIWRTSMMWYQILEMQDPQRLRDSQYLYQLCNYLEELWYFEYRKGRLIYQHGVIYQLRHCLFRSWIQLILLCFQIWLNFIGLLQSGLHSV